MIYLTSGQSPHDQREMALCENRKALSICWIIACGVYIESMLKKANGKIQGPGGAAALLGIKPNTLRHRMRTLGIPFGRQQKKT